MLAHMCKMHVRNANTCTYKCTHAHTHSVINIEAVSGTLTHICRYTLWIKEDHSYCCNIWGQNVSAHHTPESSKTIFNDEEKIPRSNISLYLMYCKMWTTDLYLEQCTVCATSSKQAKQHRSVTAWILTGEQCRNADISAALLFPATAVTLPRVLQLP